MERGNTIRFLAAGLLLSWVFVMTGLAEEVPRITGEQLKRMLADPNVAIIDVRANVDWAGSSRKIKGAIREDARRVNAWMEKYPREKTLIFYCS